MPGPKLLLTLVAALTLSVFAAQAGAERAPTGAGRVAEPPPVPSLEPERTAAEWRRLVRSKRSAAQARAAAECRPLRAVFYAASDWLRLATKLAASASPCAEYYVSVPPLVADKTQFRREQASRIRALGPNFHAMAEIHFATWTRWVASTGSSWHAAGVTARQHMAEAGYDVSQGDTWALNELTTAVRRGDGNARTNIREFLRGLYEGDGSRPTKGAALVIGFGQRTADLSVYQSTLQSWLSDSAFWTDMARYVADWSQEVYGDLRAHAVPGSPVSLRRDYLNDYLQHKLVLASAGPPEIEPARAFLRDAYSPLANGAWPRETAWGWTMVPVELMSAYLSAQVNALRYFSAASAQARDHWGFAWAPRNTTGLSNADFAEQTGRLLDRLSAAVRDSGDVVEPENPGSGACGPPGQDTFCAGDLADARHTEAWKSFRAWTQPVLRFTTGPQTVAAGTPTAAIGLTLSTSSGAPLTTPRTVAATVGSSSPSGTFSTSPTGPWTSTLALTVSSTATSAFYYLDTTAGSHTLTAAGAGATAATQVVTVMPGPVVRVTVTPPARTLRARESRRFTAAATDAHGNAVAGTATWRVRPAAFGVLTPGAQGVMTFTAGRVVGRGTVSASVTTASATVAGAASVTVVPARARVRSIGFSRSGSGVRIRLRVLDGARRPVSNARLAVVVRLDGRRLLVARTKTGAAGRALVRARGRGCFTVSVRRLSAPGFTWDGRTPRNRFCRG